MDFTFNMRILLFDYDGTIIDSTKAVHDAFNKAAEKYELKPAVNYYDFIKLYDKNVYESIVEMGLPRSRLREFFDEWRKPFLSVNGKVKLFDGIKEVIHELSKKDYIIIITSNSKKVIEISLERFKLSGIREIMGGDEEMSKVEKIEKIKNRFKGHDIYYIGDTKGDILEAKKAKVKAVAVSWGVHPRKRLQGAKPDFIADKPEVLLKIFKN